MVEQIDDSWLPYDVPDFTWLYIKNGVITEYSQSEMDASALASAIPVIHDTIDIWRDVARFSDITTIVSGNTYTWQADVESSSLISDSINLVSNGVISCPPVWRTSDNINVPITIADLKNIANTIATQVNNAFTHSWELKAQADNATTLDELNAIKW